jgi:hypothetical protein
MLVGQSVNFSATCCNFSLTVSIICRQRATHYHQGLHQRRRPLGAVSTCGWPRRAMSSKPLSVTQGPVYESLTFSARGNWAARACGNVSVNDCSLAVPGAGCQGKAGDGTLGGDGEQQLTAEKPAQTGTVAQRRLTVEPAAAPAFGSVHGGQVQHLIGGLRSHALASLRSQTAH